MSSHHGAVPEPSVHAGITERFVINRLSFESGLQESWPSHSSPHLLVAVAATLAQTYTFEGDVTPAPTPMSSSIMPELDDDSLDNDDYDDDDDTESG